MYKVSFLLDWSSDATGILHRVKLEGGGRARQTTVHTKEQPDMEREGERESRMFLLFLRPPCIRITSEYVNSGQNQMLRRLAKNRRGKEEEGERVMQSERVAIQVA